MIFTSKIFTIKIKFWLILGYRIIRNINPKPIQNDDIYLLDNTKFGARRIILTVFYKLNAFK